MGIDKLVSRMVAKDLELAKQEKVIKDAGLVVALRGIANE